MATFCACQGHLLADPSGEEEDMMEALVTVVMDEKGNLVRACKLLQNVVGSVYMFQLR